MRFRDFAAVNGSRQGSNRSKSIENRYARVRSVMILIFHSNRFCIRNAVRNSHKHVARDFQS